MKKSQLRMWVAILVCGFSMAMFTACGSSSKDDEPGGNGTDDLAYLQRRIAEEGNLVYGGQLANEGKDIINRPVETQEEALAEFYKLIPGGKTHQGLSSSGNGAITCRLTGPNGESQGTITYQPTTVYYCAEVVFGSEVRLATGVSRLRYIPYDNWPDNGFLSDLLDWLKK
jgi:hypothetical protein